MSQGERVLDRLDRSATTLPGPGGRAWEERGSRCFVDTRSILEGIGRAIGEIVRREMVPGQVGRGGPARSPRPVPGG